MEILLALIALATIFHVVSSAIHRNRVLSALDALIQRQNMIEHYVEKDLTRTSGISASRLSSIDERLKSIDQAFTH